MTTACLVVSPAVSAETISENWHQWRGPLANGIAPQGNPPLTWSRDTNLRWQTELPGEGTATPIVWGDRVFVLAARQTDRQAAHPPVAHEDAKTIPPQNVYEFLVICVRRSTGDILWERVAVAEVPHEGRHTTNTYASASPTTDGTMLYVSFGSRGIFCFDLDGNLIWRRDLGDMRTRFGWGEATSPVIHDDMLIVNWDHEDQSYIYALDAASGKTLWSRERDEPTSWGTPLVVDYENRKQIVVNGTNRVRSYGLASGDPIWECGGQTVNAIPSPLHDGGVVYCLSGYGGAAAYAIPLSSVGDVTDSQSLRWQYHRATPYVPSPILYDGRLYFTRGNSAVLTCLNADTGTAVWEQQRLPQLQNLYASPVAADGRIYFVDREGTTTVIRAGGEFQVLATNRLETPIDASPAVAGSQLFLRSATSLICLEEE